MAPGRRTFRKFRKTTRGRKYTRRSRKYNRRTSLYRSTNFGGFPKSKLVKLRYNETVSVNPGVASVTAYSFRANSIFDPNQSGTGHQPMGHDQWAAIYNHYIVLGSKIRCTFTPVNSGTGQAAFGIRLDDDGSSSSLSVSDYIEQGDSVYRVQPDNYTVSHPISLTKTFSTKKWFAIKDVMDNQTRLGAAIGSNPSEIASYVLWVGPADGSTDLGAWLLTVTIEYIVRFSEPKDMSPS